MAYLTTTTETYRVNTEEEAKQLIEDKKRESIGVVTKYSSVYRCKKVKGEIEDEFYRVSITQEFQSEKEPYDIIEVNYEKESAF